MTLPLRLFWFLLLAALPPLIILATFEALGGPLAVRLGQGATLTIVAIAAVIWVAIVTLLAARSMGSELRALVDLAERGDSHPDDQAGLEASTQSHRRLSLALLERNRQLAELAHHVRTAPIAEDVRTVVHRVVEVSRTVTRNPTWSLVILEAVADLSPGAYGTDPEDEARTVLDLHRWAAVSGEDTSTVRDLEGPWGRFVIVPVGNDQSLRAMLLAPWEGRSTPSAAELNLYQLLGQHAATTIEHTLLYGQLRSRTDALDRMRTIQTDFLRGVTHDLQTPLTSIRALAAELQHSAGIDAVAHADLETIAYQADRLRRMVGQLLVVSRLEAGAVTPKQEVFRLEPVIRRTWDALRALDRPFTLESSGPICLVVADQDRLEQVLWALFDNAVKYSPAGTGVSVATSSRNAADGSLLAEIAVSDEGAGMSQSTRERAFEQFFRADAARRDAPDGSGVGLYAARGLIEAMSGTISIDPAADSGTTVRVALPAEAVHQEHGDREAADESTVAVPRPRSQPAR